jgi:hypothetical protein
MLYAVRPAAVPAGGGEADPAARRRRQLNQALCLSLLAPHCSTYTVVAPPTSPAALPLLRWQPASLYHVSALCAAALDTATLAYRLAQAEGPDAPLGELLLPWGQLVGRDVLQCRWARGHMRPRPPALHSDTG